MNRPLRSKLVQLAAEMVRCTNMPSTFIEDWDIPKSTPIGAKREILRQALLADEQAKDWACRLRDIADHELGRQSDRENRLDGLRQEES